MKTPAVILILLVSPLLVEAVMARIGQRPIRLEGAMILGLVVAFVFFALGHFVRTDGMIAMLPHWIPFRSGVIYLTGIWEIGIAIGLAMKTYRQLSLMLAMITLVVFFPVNIHAAMNYSGLGGHQWGPVYLVVRAPLQLFLIGWCIVTYRLITRRFNPCCL